MTGVHSSLVNYMSSTTTTSTKLVLDESYKNMTAPVASSSSNSGRKHFFKRPGELKRKENLCVTSEKSRDVVAAKKPKTVATESGTPLATRRNRFKFFKSPHVAKQLPKASPLRLGVNSADVDDSGATSVWSAGIDQGPSGSAYVFP